MRIAINSRSFVNPHYTGIGRYAYNLTKSLVAVDPTNDYFLYVPVKIFDRDKKVPNLRASNLTLKRDWFKRGLTNVLPPVDLYHSPSPDIVFPMKAKVIVTLHDFVYKAFPTGHTEQTLKLTDDQMKSFLPHVSKLICCSHNTREDLHRFFKIDRSKSCVIHHGTNKEMFYPMNAEQKRQGKAELKQLGINDPFILFVGTIEPRKNLKGLLTAFSRLKKKKAFNGKLVVAGMKGWKSDDIEDFLKNLGIKDDVIFLGFIDDHQLRYLYNLCEVFVFPSFYEGFGYPILEAFSCATACVVSNAASCPEIAKDASLSTDPNSTEQMTNAIEQILSDAKLKASLSAKAFERSKEFSFEKNARETLAVYQEVYQS